jgi:hypothetical protein
MTTIMVVVMFVYSETVIPHLDKALLHTYKVPSFHGAELQSVIEENDVVFIKVRVFNKTRMFLIPCGCDL